MTRFLMSLEDAVELVLYAFHNGKAGDIFVQKAPASTIMDLAKALLIMLNADNDEIKYIGTRHGEKKHETLVTREEMQKSVDHGNYFRIPSDTRELNYDRFFEVGDVKIDLSCDYTSANTQQLAVDDIVEKLAKLDLFNKPLDN
jgi:UDP-N-acetylglucosamine 4,6-dehydratase/5-epimerase